MGYRSNEDMAEDNHSSAVVLISVGALGLLADIYMLIKNPLSMPMFNKYMTTGIMGSLFVLFIVMGALAMRNYKRFTEAAVKESTLSEKIHEWCVDNLTANTIEEAVDNSDDSEDSEEGKEEGVYDEETGKKIKRIVFTGPKGGRYYKTDNGEKVYIDENRVKGLGMILLESKMISLTQYIKEKCCTTSQSKK